MTVFQRSLMSRFECPGKQTNWSHEWLKFSRGFRQSSMPCSQSDAGAEVTSRQSALVVEVQGGNYNVVDISPEDAASGT